MRSISFHPALGVGLLTVPLRLQCAAISTRLLTGEAEQLESNPTTGDLVTLILRDGGAETANRNMSFKHSLEISLVRELERN